MVTDIYTKNYLAYLATYWTKKNNLLCSFLKYRVSFLHIHSMIYLYTSVVVMYSYIFKWTAPNYICVRWIVQRTLCRVLLNRRKRLWQWERRCIHKEQITWYAFIAAVLCIWLPIFRHALWSKRYKWSILPLPPPFGSICCDYYVHSCWAL